MKIRAITLLFMIVLISSIFARSILHAQSQDDSQQSTFAARCTTAQGELSGSIKAQDLKTRVYRVQAYEYIHKRLDVFAGRLEHNRQPYAKELREQTTQLNVDIAQLTVDYEGYDKARESVSSMKSCGTNQAKFTTLLNDMRAKRQRVNNDVTTIDTLLSTIVRSDISDLYSKLLITGTSGVSHD